MLVKLVPLLLLNWYEQIELSADDATLNRFAALDGSSISACGGGGGGFPYQRTRVHAQVDGLDGTPLVSFALSNGAAAALGSPAPSAPLGVTLAFNASTSAPTDASSLSAAGSAMMARMRSSSGPEGPPRSSAAAEAPTEPRGCRRTPHH